MKLNLLIYLQNKFCYKQLHPFINYTRKQNPPQRQDRQHDKAIVPPKQKLPKQPNHRNQTVSVTFPVARGMIQSPTFSLINLTSK